MGSIKIFILSVGLVSLMSMKTMPQHFISLHKDEIKLKMQDDMKGFNLDNTSVNKTFNYLKYVDYLGQQTILFFMDENDICTAWKWMCDYSLLEEKVKELNDKFKPAGENRWTFKHNDKQFEVKLDKEEWFFSIITRAKKQ